MLLPIPIMSLERQVFKQPTVSKFLFSIVLPIGVIRLHHMSLKEYGIDFGNLRYHLKTSFWAMAIVLPGSGVVFSLLGGLNISYTSLIAGIVLSLLHLVFLVLIGISFKKRNPDFISTGSDRLVAMFFILFAILAGLSTLNSTVGVAFSVLAFDLFSTGFGEEILFRGYIQSRLNHSFGKPFHTWGVSWGPGLIIASALFGILHCLQHTGTIWLGMWTFFGGLVFGWLRERTGSIIAPALVHGVPYVLFYFMQLLQKTSL